MKQPLIDVTHIGLLASWMNLVDFQKSSIRKNTVCRSNRNLFNHLPFIVGDVLHLCDVDFPGLLVKPLIVPVWVEVRQLLGQSVVFSHPHGVESSQTGLLVGSSISCAKNNKIES